MSNERTCPVCGFNETEYNKDKKPYDQLEWLTTDEQVHYTTANQWTEAQQEQHSSDMLICPICGVLQITQPHPGRSPDQPPTGK